MPKIQVSLISLNDINILCGFYFITGSRFLNHILLKYKIGKWRNEIKIS
jgi:hypothetical protein